MNDVLITVVQQGAVEITAGPQASSVVSLTNIGPTVAVQDEGIVVVGAPTAINFTGAGVTATNVGGVATVNVPNVGTVTSVALAVPAGFSVTGSPVTASGTLTISYGTGFQGYTAAESVKLAGIATGATANATDAALRDRATHTGTQPHTTITGLGTAATQPISAFEPAGAVAAHVAAADPHPQYLTPAEASAAYAAATHTHDASAIVSGTIDPARLPVFPSTVQIVAATIAGLTAGEQAQIGDGSLVTTTDGRRWIYTGAGSKTDESSYIVLADVTPEWGAISGRPTTLAGYGITDAAPAVHGHAIAQVTGLQVALDAKLDDAQATPAGLALLGAADAAAQRTAIGLGTAATADSTAFEVAGAVTAHVAAADPHPQYLTPAEGNAAYAAASHTHTASQISDSTGTGRALITAADAAAGRTALGLGTASTQNTGTSGATVPLLNGANTWGGVQTFSSTITYGGITQAVVQAGARPHQQMVWNQAAGRAEALDTAILHGDWNTAVENGWWVAPGALNAPIQGVWLIGHVIRHDANWITQEVWDFTLGTTTPRYRRHLQNGVWSAWASEHPIGATNRFNPTTSDVQFAASTVAGAFGGGHVQRDGSVWTGMWTQSDSTMRFGIGGSGGLTERALLNAEGWEDGRGNLRDVPLNIQNINYTITTSDRGRKIIKSDDTARIYTIPSGLPQGMTLAIRNKTGVSNITISPASGVTLLIAGSGGSATRTIAPWGEALLHCEGVNEWVISGVGVS